MKIIGMSVNKFFVMQKILQLFFFLPRNKQILVQQVEEKNIARGSLPVHELLSHFSETINNEIRYNIAKSD